MDSSSDKDDKDPSRARTETETTDMTGRTKAPLLPPMPVPIRKGSRPELKGSSQRLFDSKATYYRYVQSQDKFRIKEARAMRRQYRARLESEGKTQHDLHPTVQSSSSSSESSSAEDEPSDWERETVDFQELATHDCSWASENLFSAMPVPEISSLVGWATHCTHDGESSSKTEKTNQHATTDQSEAKACSHSDLASVSDTPVAKQLNPLLVLPNTPLPPSHLHYLHETARNYIKHPAARESYKPQVSTKKRKRAQKKADDDMSHLYQSLDDSALVALGMVWQETITALLLPLARQHVERCRRLEQSGEDSFPEWTLPPEQAIWRLAQDGYTRSDLPSTVDQQTPTADPDEQKQQVVDDWCRIHELDSNFVTNNMDLFGVLLPCHPTQQPLLESSTSHGDKKVRATKPSNKRCKVETESNKPNARNDGSESQDESSCGMDSA